MKYKMFKRKVKVINALIEKESDFNKRLQDVLGGDSYVITDLFNAEITELVKILTEEMNDTSEWIDYLIYEVNMHNSDLTFEIDNVSYKSCTKNIYKMLTGKI